MKPDNTIKGIILVFEDMTYQFIPAEYIRSLGILGVKECITKPLEEDNEVQTELMCEEFYLSLSHEMKDMKTKFAEECPSLGEGETIFKRIISNPDIVKVVLVYTNGNHKEMYIPWENKDGNEYINSLISCKIDKSGNLVVESKER